jgi:hypothetical protein
MPAILNHGVDQAKAFFFDRSAVLDKVAKMKAGGLKQCGAVTRRIARNSLRRSPNPSKPGRPPNVHGSDSLLKKFIFFTFDPGSFSCLVGPTRINSSMTAAAGDTVPAILEHGGTTHFRGGSYLDTTSTTGRVRRRMYAAVARYVQPRPFMEPALQKAADKYPRLFANAWTNPNAATGDD